MNPQAFNRYTYVYNNPLRYNDPTGQWPSWEDIKNVRKKVVEGLQVAVSKVKEATMHAVGIERVEYYTDTNLMADSVPVYHVGDEGIVPSLLGDLSGISLYPVGTFVKESALALDPNLPAHESFHYAEQAVWGMINWTAAYYGEMYEVSE